MAEYLLKIKFDLDTGKFAAGTTHVKNDAKETHGAVKIAFEGIKAQITAVSFAYNQVKQVVGDVIQVVKSVAKPFVDAQTDMANVASLGVKNINELNAGIQNLGQEVGVPLHNLRGGLYQVVSAGVDATHQITVLESAARAAKAGMTETTDALNLGSSVIKGYGKNWSEFDSVMDQAFQTVKLGQTTFPELAGAIGGVVPLASALKIKTTELFGAFATLTGVTGNTNEVATQLRGIFQGLAKPTEGLLKLIKQSGYATVEDAVAKEGLAGVLKKVADATGGSATKMGELFGSVEAVNGILALSSSQYNTMIDKTRAMTEASGSMNEAFRVSSDTIATQIQLLENKWSVVLEKAVGEIAPFAMDLLNVAEVILDTRDYVDKLSDSVGRLNDEIKRQTEFAPLVARYAELKKEAHLTAAEQEELRSVTEKLSRIFPEAVTAVDNYGRALDLNIPQIHRMVEEQKALLRANQSDVYNKNTEALRYYLNTITDGQENIKKANAESNHQITTLEKVTQAFQPHLNFGAYINSWRGEISKANKEIDKILPLLSNFTDLQNPEQLKQISVELGLTADQYGFLTIKVQEYLKSFSTTTPPPGAIPPPGTTTPAGTMTPAAELLNAEYLYKKGEDTLDQYYNKKHILLEASLKEAIDKNGRGSEEAIKAQMVIWDFEQAIAIKRREQAQNLYTQPTFGGGTETTSLEQDLQNQYDLNQNMLDARLISEQEFYNSKNAIAQQNYDDMVALHGAESDDAIAALAVRNQAELDSANFRKSINQQAASAIGQLVVGIFSFTKAGAYASAIVNTYEAATKALAGGIPPWNYISMAGVILSGLAQVAKISETKIEKKAGGGSVFEEMAYLVGEKGPELFVPNRNGAIVSNRDLMSTPGVDLSSIQSAIKKGFENAKIEIRAELNAMQFYRDTYTKYTENESQRTAL